jgi:hypothetical protein
MEFKIIKLVLCLTSLCGAFLSFPVSSEIRNESPVRLANKKIAYAESDISKSLGFHRPMCLRFQQTINCQRIVF